MKYDPWVESGLAHLEPSDDPTFFDIRNPTYEFADPVMDQLLTLKSAAKFLALTPRALRIMSYEAKIPVYRLGRQTRFKLRDCVTLIDDFMENA
ncbi:MAG: helix-turn-helix domain-containing protein [Xanthomonadaceae bacterium]|nr:helix-turn-helix domain-containing protein [Xanthomonadaceae bacterium]